MTWQIKNDRELRHLVNISGWPDEAIAERMNCDSGDVYERRVFLGLLAIPCREPPWADALRRKERAAKAARKTARKKPEFTPDDKAGRLEQIRRACVSLSS